MDIFQVSKAGYAHFRDVHFPCPGRTGSVGTNYMRPPSDSALVAALWASGSFEWTFSWLVDRVSSGFHSVSGWGFTGRWRTLASSALLRLGVVSLGTESMEDITWPRLGHGSRQPPGQRTHA